MNGGNAAPAPKASDMIIDADISIPAAYKLKVNDIDEYIAGHGIELLKALIGTPAAPTAAPGTNTTQIATTAFVAALGALKANLADPTFTGTPAAPTAAPGTNTTQLATTAFVAALGALKANLADPTFTGTPAAPTAAPGTNTTQLATTAFVAALGALKANTSHTHAMSDVTFLTPAASNTLQKSKDTASARGTTNYQYLKGIAVPQGWNEGTIRVKWQCPTYGDGTKTTQLRIGNWYTSAEQVGEGTEFSVDVPYVSGGEFIEVWGKGQYTDRVACENLRIYATLS